MTQFPVYDEKNQETILVVDDSYDNQLFLKESLLEPAGFNVITASDGHDGLVQVMQQRPDLILLDLQMPRMNGIQLLQQLSAKQVRIPIILMTFYGSEEIAVEVYRLGVKDYVKKPFHPRDMLNAIERSLRELRLERERDELTRQLVTTNLQLNERIEELDSLYKAGRRLTSTVSQTDLVTRIVEAACSIANAQKCEIYTYKYGQMARIAYYHVDEHKLDLEQIVVDLPAVLSVIETGTVEIFTATDDDGPSPETEDAAGESAVSAPVYSGETISNTPVEPDGYHNEATLCAPLQLQNRTIGALCVTKELTVSGRFTESNIYSLGLLADYAAVALENAQLFDALREAHSRAVNTFGRFVAPSIVQQALREPELARGGKRQTVSVLFADLRNFTSWSEHVDPKYAVDTLNQYLSLAATVITRWGGTLDKFLGDGVMALFNAPASQKQHVRRMVCAAIELIQLTEKHEMHMLRYSVGLNMGEAVVGFIGSETALNYTAIGDTVNLAKRLQEIARPGQIVVPSAIANSINDYVQPVFLGEIQVRGRQQKTLVFQVPTDKASSDILISSLPADTRK